MTQQRDPLTLLTLIGALALAILTLNTLRELYALDLMFLNPNTWRDVPTYRDITEGLIPLQGPTTSIGGHHGVLGTWPWALALWWAPEPRSLWWAALLLYGCTGLVMCGLTRSMASAPATVAAMMVLGSTNLFLMPQFPSHIMFLPLGATLTLVGWLRADRGAAWAWLATAGITLTAGSHRSGWILLGLVFALDLAGRRSLTRGTRWACWAPVVLYAGLSQAVHALPGGPAPEPREHGLLQEILLMNPPQLLLQVPFMHFEYAWMPWLQVPQLLLVGGLWWTAWRHHTLPLRERLLHDESLLLIFYAVWFVGLVLYKYDTHYIMPMMGALPGVLALGLDALREHTRQSRLTGWIGLLLIQIVSAVSIQRQARKLVEVPESGLRPIGHLRQAIATLDDLGVSEAAFYAQVTFEPSPPQARVGEDEVKIGWMHRAFSRRVGEDGPFEACIYLTDVEPRLEDGRQIVAIHGPWRIETSPPSTEGCTSNIAPFGPTLWWWDVARGRLTLRQTGSPDRRGLPEGADR